MFSAIFSVHFSVDRYDEYWIVNRKLMENSDQNPLLHVPIRIYRVSFLMFGSSLRKESES